MSIKVRVRVLLNFKLKILKNTSSPNLIMIPSVAYARVSTDEQNPKYQVEYISSWARSRNFHILKFYVDYGIGGTVDVMRRPGFKELIEDLEKNIFDMRPQVLLIFELSRLARSIRELVKIWDLLENKYGILIVSTSEKESFLWSIDSTLRNFLRVVIGYVAEMEREMIRQRTRAAMVRVRDKIPRIYDKLPRSEIVENYLKGMTIYALSRKYGVSRSVILRVLIEEGVYNVDNDVCPRCFHKMKIVDRAFHNGKVLTRYYCSNCGFERLA